MYILVKVNNNNFMLNLLFALILIILLVIVIQLTLKLKLYFNIKQNTGKLQLKFLSFTVIDYSLSFHFDYIKLTNRKGKNSYLPIEFNEQAIQEYNDFQQILFKKTYFKNLTLYLNFGIKNNAFITSMVCGYFDIITKIFYTVFKTKKNEVEFLSKIYPNYKTNVIKIAVKAKLSISIFDLIWSYFESKLTLKNKSIRSKTNARQQNRKLNGTSN